MENAVEHPTVLDTDRHHLGAVYAKALLAVGQKANKLDEVLKEVNSFSDDVISKMPKLRLTLESPRIAFEEKLPIIEKITKGKCSKEFSNFLKVLTKKGRFDCLHAVKESANEMFNEMSGTVQATLTTAESVDEQVAKRVATQLEKVLGKKVELKTRVDKEIIAGFLVRVGDTVFDGSVANQLEQVRTNAMQQASQKIRTALDRFVSTPGNVETE